MVGGAGVAQSRPYGQSEQVADAAGAAIGGLGLVEEAVLSKPEACGSTATPPAADTRHGVAQARQAHRKLRKQGGWAPNWPVFWEYVDEG
ncbi:hypothetical protein OG257_34200 [Streptomyces sp. NBC_00683]|uniref:hypothetical protein n=1 Tax=Streptomyces sp. NBC_00683 TaxID=2903670 RepID=UPI002E2F1F2E|nr:hypothetical protein [Streptomyces sp. NBC_00683]